MKKCGKCSIVKDLSEFYHDATKKYGVSSRCKKCIHSYSQVDYEKNKDRHNAKSASYYLAHKDRFREWSKAYNSRPEKKAEDSRRRIAKIDKKMKWFLEHIGSDKLHCDRCKYDRSFTAIQFHHKDPSQKENVHDSFSKWIRKYSFEKFQEIVLKTDMWILCANCHAEYHAGLWK